LYEGDCPWSEACGHAWISNDVARLGRFYSEVFDAEVGATRPHGEDGDSCRGLLRDCSVGLFPAVERTGQSLVLESETDGACGSVAPGESLAAGR
jgi:hypothetical protein